VARITGLDPSGTLYDTKVSAEEQIRPRNAEFVEIFHTNAGRIGQADSQSGTINVFVNGGTSQPGCEVQDKLPIQCM